MKKIENKASNYISRNQALKKLQVTLPDFRRLCILKGIYPREPKNRRKLQKGNSQLKTYYYLKDIQYLLHEPILQKFREYKTFAKKLSKLVGKKEWHSVKRMEQNKPIYSLDHIVKERYPSFIDAVRDLDDCLCMVFLFASLPQTNNITSDISAKCKTLCQEFQYWVIRTRALKKVFVSIKGIYYQVEIKGQTVTWIVPFEFSQHMPIDVDFRVMLTFLEFYETLLGFVNFKLLSELGIDYPPKLDNFLADDGQGLENIIPEDRIAHDEVQEALDSEKLQSLESKIEEVANQTYKSSSD